MQTKLVKDLIVGDRVMIIEPDAEARIVAKERSRLFSASGGCFRLDMKVESGPHKGQSINDQHHPGDDAVQIVQS